MIGSCKKQATPSGTFFYHHTVAKKGNIDISLTSSFPWVNNKLGV
jgi:hypothetical protein